MLRPTLKYITLLFFIPFYAQDQEHFNQKDKEGKRHGKWKIDFEDDSQIKFTGTFEHGEEVGDFKFYKKGFEEHPTAIMNFSRETDSVFVTYYTQEGKPISEGKMLNQQREGEWIYYHKNSSEIMMLEEYKNGMLHGEQITYYPEGAPAEKTTYKNHKKHGESSIYSESGQLLQKVNYKEDKLHGDAVYYNEEGDKLQEGHYEKGEKSDNWKNYEDDKEHEQQK